MGRSARAIAAAPRSKSVSEEDHAFQLKSFLAYWVDISKRPTLTGDDFRKFLRMTEDTFRHFVEHYGWYRNRHIEEQRDLFFKQVHSLIWWQKEIAEKEIVSGSLTNSGYTVVKQYARKFISRIRKCFGQQVARDRREDASSGRRAPDRDVNQAHLQVGRGHRRL